MREYSCLIGIDEDVPLLLVLPVCGGARPLSLNFRVGYGEKGGIIEMSYIVSFQNLLTTMFDPNLTARYTLNFSPVKVAGWSDISTSTARRKASSLLAL